jgi:hypothetical protein
LQARAREVTRKRARLYAARIAQPLTPKQFEALRAHAARFSERIEASKADAITPRAASPAEIS